MKKTLFVMMTIGLVAGASAQDAVKEADAKGSKETGKEEKAESTGIAKLLKDQLIKIEGEEVKPAKLKEGMEYYLVYHSASW